VRVHTTGVIFVLVAVVCVSGCGSNAPISVSMSPESALVGSGQVIQFTATVMGNTSGVDWSVNGVLGGNATVGIIDSLGNYTAPNLTQNGSATITATSRKDSAKSSSAQVTIIAPGSVSTTPNVQVGQYTITVPEGLSVFVQFGLDTTYAFTTWTLPAPMGGGPVSILVAGMKGDTPYHMRAVFQSTGSTTPVFTDVDHTFTTGAYPAAILPSLTVTNAAEQTPQSGVELLNLIRIGTPTGQSDTVVTDLNGNVLWLYDPGSSVPAGDLANPIKLLPNGHFLIIYSGVNPDGQNSVTQEVDLAGNIFWQLTSAQLNAALASATCSGCNITVIGIHHDFAVLPNGHVVFIAATQQTISGTLVTGDVLIDFDQNHNPVWLWNAFDHLDVNRHPMSFPDWTHSNAIVYSPDDKALMLSIRHQAWVIKINYNDGAGDGSILWKLGYQGDFTLLPGTTNAADPVDWFNAQHDANIISSNTAGNIQLLLFDNGNQRVLNASGTLCGPATSPCDSRVPVLQLDESAKTADIVWVDKLAPLFSFFGGSARLLRNGNIEFDECAATPLPANNAVISEVTETSPPTTIWQMQIAGQYAYRGFRIPSLYPGVQW
jgi:arylsulfate sulfotransferase